MHGSRTEAGIVDGHPGDQSHLFEGSVTSSPEEEILLMVVTLEDVQVAVPVEVEHRDPHALRVGSLQARLLGDIHEPSIWPLFVELALLPVVLLGVGHLPLFARVQVMGVEGQEVAHREVEIAIPVVVEPGASDAPLDEAIQLAAGRRVPASDATSVKVPSPLL